jgi:hypothetical protein
MSWPTATILTAGVWAMTLSAQTLPPQPTVNPLVKKFGQQKTAVCSIPLREVPFAKAVDPMPNLLPPAGTESLDKRAVNVPAPPCPEEKR